MENVPTKEELVALKAKVEEANENRLAARNTVLEAIGHVLNRRLAASGVTGYTFSAEHSHGIEYLRLVRVNQAFASEITLEFDYPHYCHAEGDTRILKLNPSTCGSFKWDDFDRVAYYALCGYLATHLKEIQDELNGITAIVFFDRFDAAFHKIHREYDEKERIKREADREAKEGAVLSQLAVGTVIVTGRQQRWDDKAEKLVDGKLTVYTVERVTPKLLWFKETYRQYKKSEVTRHCAYGHWRIATDADWAELASYGNK